MRAKKSYRPKPQPRTCGDCQFMRRHLVGKLVATVGSCQHCDFVTAGQDACKHHRKTPS